MSPSKTRVAFVVDGFRLGGTETSALRMVDQLSGFASVVKVICIGGPDASGPLEQLYADREIPVAWCRVGPFFRSEVVRQIRQLGACVAEADVDVIHAHDLYSDLACSLARAFGTLPHVRFVASHRWGRPQSLTWRLLSRFAYFTADAVVANGPGALEIARQLTPLGKTKVSLLPNVVSVSEFGADASSFPNRSTVTIAMLGRLVSSKRVDLAVRALAEPSLSSIGATLLVGGGGPELQRLQELAEQCGVSDRVRFLGEVPRKPSIFGRAAVALHCSRNEGTPNVLLEALAVGCPIVAVGVGGIPALLTAARSGTLVAPNDATPNHLASAVADLLKDAERAASYRAAGQRYIEENHSPDRWVEAVRVAYRG